MFYLTNHYILQNGAWVQARDFPGAIEASPWKGGKNLPLICLNTDKNRITFNHQLVFSDYDETTLGDQKTMCCLQNTVNNIDKDLPIPYNFSEYSPAMSPNTKICLKNGARIPIKSVAIGDVLSTNYRVVGIINKEITRIS